MKDGRGVIGFSVEEPEWGLTVEAVLFEALQRTRLIKETRVRLERVFVFCFYMFFIVFI